MTHHYCIGNPCLLCSPQRYDIPTVVAEACLGCNQPRPIWGRADRLVKKHKETK